MTAFDDLLDELAGGLDSLPRRAVSAFFLACGTALLVEYQRWASHRGIEPPLALRSTSEAVTEFITQNVPPATGRELLSELEAVTPPGDSPDDVSSTSAQDCVICLDTSLRVAIDGEFDAGPCVEYALQPITESVSQRLFGVSQVGSGINEPTEMASLLADSRFREAVEFCRWGASFVGSGQDMSVQDLSVLTQRAREALVP